MVSTALQTPNAEHLNTLIEALPDTMVFKDGAGRWRVANAAALQFFGLNGHDWQGKTNLELAAALPHLAEALTICDQDDQRTWALAQRCNFIMPAQDGCSVISIAKIPLFNPDGSRRGLAVVAHDFADSIKVDSSLAAASQMLLNVLNSMDCVVYVVDASTHEIIFVNQYAECNLSKTIKVGGLCWEETQCGQGAPCNFRDEFNPPDVNGNTGGGHEWEYLNPGNQRWYRVRNSATRWVDGRLARLEIATDITDKKSRETRRWQRQEALCHASRVSIAGQMASGLAHEISQPLAAAHTYLQGCLGLIGSDQHDMAKLGEAIKFAHIQTERAGKIVSHLRKFVGNGSSERKKTDINQLVIDTAQFLSHEIQSHRVDVTFHLSDLPLVCVNPIELEQVFVNLLINAIEAMRATPVRKLEISTRRLPCALEVEIRDVGTGIPDSEIERVFNPFISSKKDGLGLGLPICRSIIESYGGKIQVLSPPDFGAIFSFTLPIEDHV